MTPTQYKARYERLVVPLADGSSTTVKVNQYRLRSSKNAYDKGGYNERAAHAFLNKLDRSGIDIELRVDSGPETFRILDRKPDGQFSVHEMTRIGAESVESDVFKRVRSFARYVFAGKGAPEHCQIVLQLVDHWKLAPDGLQAYADAGLGLDCNGFVGNYLLHVKRGVHWTEQGLKANEGPDSTISQYFVGKKLISRWQDMIPARSYIFGMAAHDSAAIVEGGGNSPATAGHIAITEPSWFRPAGFSQPSAVFVVESTAAHKPGLWASWYSPLGMDKFPKVFKVKREDMMASHREVRFKIAEVQ
jgi:hypothetical protein